MSKSWGILEMTRGVGSIFIALTLLTVGFGSYAWASQQVPQTPLPGKSIAKYVTPLDIFNGNRATGSSLQVRYQEFQQEVLPATFYSALAINSITVGNTTFNPQAGTWVWGYQVENSSGVPFFPKHFPADTIIAQKGTPTTVKYINELPLQSLLQKYITVDQTIHWADPLGTMMSGAVSFFPYSGPPAVVAHLHGGETPSAFDGGPEQWWTPNDGGNNLVGPGYVSLGGHVSGQATYKYINSQDAATLWYHEHTLGATRTNVYSGLAGYYFLRDSFDTGDETTGLKLPSGQHEAEFVIQGRQFDTNGQLLFPDGFPAGLNGPPPNPTVHPFWIPEFFGDVICVNGRSWPFYSVEARRYRFRFLNGSNARFYNLSIGTGKKGTVTMYVIGTDGGLLDKPVPVTNLLFAPGERYDVIIDFAPFVGTAAAPTLLTMTNDAKAPFPGGAPADPQTVGQIIQFQVGALPAVADNSFDPAAAGATLRVANSAANPAPIVRLPGAPGAPALALPGSATPNIDKVRKLILKENAGPGGPLEVLVNNTKWSGKFNPAPNALPGSGSPIPDSSALVEDTSAITGGRTTTNYLTELPQVGSTELWEIINLTVDAHPIHLHLVQFQIVNRQAFQANKYISAWTALFPGGVYTPGFGPPQPYNFYYNAVNKTGWLGGNPDPTPYLQGAPTPPLPNEQGWKDTVIAYPGEVTRIVVRWAPLDMSLASVTAGTNYYASTVNGGGPDRPFGFDPTVTMGATDADGNPGGPGYVWHCHIIDHEDNEMMRPYIPVNNANNVLP